VAGIIELESGLVWAPGESRGVTHTLFALIPVVDHSELLNNFNLGQAQAIRAPFAEKKGAAEGLADQPHRIEWNSPNGRKLKRTNLPCIIAALPCITAGSLLLTLTTRFSGRRQWPYPPQGLERGNQTTTRRCHLSRYGKYRVVEKGEDWRTIPRLARKPPHQDSAMQTPPEMAD
jgi:hypothetical protein